MFRSSSQHNESRHISSIGQRGSFHKEKISKNENCSDYSRSVWRKSHTGGKTNRTLPKRAAKNPRNQANFAGIVGNEGSNWRLGGQSSSKKTFGLFYFNETAQQIVSISPVPQMNIASKRARAPKRAANNSLGQGNEKVFVGRRLAGRDRPDQQRLCG
jgi:hypothetical protein